MRNKKLEIKEKILYIALFIIMTILNCNNNNNPNSFITRIVPTIHTQHGWINFGGVIALGVMGISISRLLANTEWSSNNLI